MAMDWFRSWHGAPTDHKWLVVARKAGTVPGIVSAVAWALFDYASQHNERGSIEGFDVETYAVFSGFDEATVQAIIDAMTDKAIIIDGRLAAWDKRQPKREDDSRERVRRYREKQRDSVDGNTTSRIVTQGNAPDRDSDTDTEKRERREAESTAAPDIDPDFGQAVTLMHKHVGTLTGFQLTEIQERIDQLRSMDCLPWFEMAVNEAISYNKRSWAYVRSILDRSIQQQKPPGSTRPNGGGHTRYRPSQSVMEALEEGIRIMEAGGHGTTSNHLTTVA